MTRGPISGDPCPRADCSGRLATFNTTVNTDTRTRYLRCNECSTIPLHNKWIVPLKWAPKR